MGLRRFLVTLGVFAGSALVVAWVWQGTRTEPPAYESIMATLPLPEEVPAVNLPNFRLAHPRLPAPSRADLSAIAREKPTTMNHHRRRAKGGEGKIRSSLIVALHEPGSIDLNALFDRVMSVRPGHRGNRADTAAIAYDWLHDHWNAAQRSALREHLMEICQGPVAAIREQRLSPYNVYLYNRPLQSMTACAIALYRDTPKADALMNFAYSYWRETVMPVWNQVMGTTGGWHEGGEYVGIGIGKAIFKVPYMWEKATGEPQFADLTGIAGMLDFLVHRIRPDGTQIRWGDASVFGKGSQDQTGLALLFRHAAAYGGERCPERYAPSAWPWGHLNDPDLCDTSARRRLPTAAFFDGIGMLIARSDWSPDASFVTFKAGNNYWSHSHLDQGAFTIFKRSPLAIDSGLYGPRYGSDHHLNYTYQSIAHNVVLVYDPDDDEPLQTQKGLREIANDGGQRRVGSGWGLNPAPLDLAEWQEKAELYRTARVIDRIVDDDFSAVTADLTPAYNNSLSRKGAFSHRTHRVTRYIRTFAYHPDSDLVLVHDALELTRPSLRPTWVLHSVHAPSVTGSRFSIQDPETGVALIGLVVEPQNALVQPIGGPGFEFWVDGFNYDEDGKVQVAAAKKRGFEPGQWRVEVTPSHEGKNVEFLVLLTLEDPATRPAAAETGWRDGRRVVRSQRAGRETRFEFDGQGLSATVDGTRYRLDAGAHRRE